MIEGIDLCKSFNDRVLFQNFSFTVKSGEFICFSGASGTGKTTLLNIIGQLETPTSGHILYDGNEIKTNRQRISFFRSKVGFIFQNFALVDNKTVEQNLKFVRKQDRNPISCEEALSKVGLIDKKHKKIYELSGGEQQRVALARLFIKKCDIILADEPTGSLDRYNASLVIHHLMQLNEQGKTIILVTHDEQIKKICNKIIEL